MPFGTSISLIDENCVATNVECIIGVRSTLGRIFYLGGKLYVRKNMEISLRKNNLIQFLLGYLQDDDIKGFWSRQDCIPQLNNYIDVMLNGTRLDSSKDMPRYHIFDANTQGLDTLLVMIINCIEEIIEIQN